MYLFLKLILSFDGDKKVIYSTNRMYEYWPGSMYEAAPEHYKGCSLIFKSDAINMISFDVDDDVSFM